MRKCNTSFFVGARFVAAGELVEDSDPILRGREHLFDAPVRAAGPVIESATAAPGEKRATRRSTKKTSE